MLQMRHYCQEGRIWDIALHSCSGNQHEESGDVDLIGPFCELSVPVASGSTRPSTRSVEVVVFDLDMDGASHITATLPEGVEDQAVKSFGLYRGTRVPLLEAAANFLTTGGDRLQGYVTAEEFEAASQAPNGAGAADATALLQQLLSQSEVTQRTVSGMKLGDLQKRLERLEQQGHPLKAHCKSRCQPSAVQRQCRCQAQASCRSRSRTTWRSGCNSASSGGGEGPSVSVCHPGKVGFESQQSKRPFKPAGRKLRHRGRRNSERLWSQGDCCKTVAWGELQEASCKGAECLQGKTGDCKEEIIHGRIRATGPVAALSRSGAVGISQDTDLYMAFMAAAMYEAMERADMPRLSMLVALQAIFEEQASYDGGSLRMAHLLTMLEDPPFQQTEMHWTSKMEFAHSQLADPRWIAINLAYLKDLEGISEKNQKYAKSLAKPPNSVPEDPGPKKKAWKKKNAKKGGEAGEEDA